MRTLCVDPPSTKQLAILTLAWMKKRSSIEILTGKMWLLNMTGQYIQHAFYTALCITLTNNHVYAASLDALNIEALTKIALAIFALFLSPFFGLYDANLQIGKPNEEISTGNIQMVMCSGAIWFNNAMDELGIRNMASNYFVEFYDKLIYAVRTKHSVRVDHYIHNITQFLAKLLPIDYSDRYDPQSLILKLRIANHEETLIANASEVSSGEIIAIKTKPIVSTDFTNEIINPVTMATIIPTNNMYGTPQQTVYTTPANLQSGVQVLPSTGQPQQPVQYINPQQPQMQYVTPNPIQGNPTVQYVTQQPQQQMQYMATPQVATLQPQIQYVATPQVATSQPQIQYMTTPQTAMVNPAATNPNFPCFLQQPAVAQAQGQQFMTVPFNGQTGMQTVQMTPQQISGTRIVSS